MEKVYKNSLIRFIKEEMYLWKKNFISFLINHPLKMIVLILSIEFGFM